MMQLKNIIIVMISLFILYANLYADIDSDFEQKINSLKWIAYSPTDFNPQAGKYPGKSSIMDDLKTLIDAGFNGLITYSSESVLADIPKIAKELGFKRVIMGIWDIRSQLELDNAIGMSGYADGYCVGNEGLQVRYELAELREVIKFIKIKTNKPATTTEEIRQYAKQDVIEIGDWIFPNAHPVLYNIKSPPKAVEWIKKYHQIVKRSAPSGKPILFKEIGYPTSGDSLCNENNQAEFFSLMESTDVKFACFEAFDQYWKDYLPFEPYWGIFDSQRVPKKFIRSKISSQAPLPAAPNAK